MCPKINTDISYSAGETVDAAAVLQLLKDFGVDNLPTEEDLKAFQYDAEDLEEAVTHCASPTLTLPFLPDTNLVVSKIQDPVDTATQKPLSELAAVGVASESVPDQSDKTVQTPTDEATETAASISGPARDPPNDVEETQRFADNHDWSKGRILDFDRGYVQFDEDGKIELSTCTVKFEIASDGQKIVTFVKPDDLGIDQEAAKALNNSAEANPNTMDYPMMDLQGRPRYAFNQAYRLGFNEDGSLIMRAPDVHVDHYNYAEHMFLGNELHLRFGPDTVRAADRKLRLANGLELSYGQINGLGGDFFGGFKPICQGKDFEEQCKFFTQAYGCLGEDPNAVAEVDKILKTREEEVAAIGNAVRNGTSAAAAYKKMAAEASWFGMKEEGELQLITVNRPNSGEYQAPSYLRLAQLNLDHFGDDARTAYSAGHYCAMGKAAEGNLDVAYAMNAFADHYLGDCFAAGHMRTPRRFLHAGDTRGAVAWGSMNIVALAILLAPDLCSKVSRSPSIYSADP